ncbi:MAG: hypothetical protein LAO79_09450 [Acidobacteriia bacterium]|nr:hypothetical protein [Terriglobia bacterium]
MATLTAVPAAIPPRRAITVHRFLVLLAAFASASLIVSIAIYGGAYYRAPLEDRALSPLHSQLRSSGTIGLKLGMLGVGLFAIIFLYPLRKRAKWLAGAGGTRYWLDFHVVAGITAPLVITFHSAFHTQGVAGLAYWIMIAVALSGFIGRYVYAQIPRTLHSVTLSVGEMEAQMSTLTEGLAHQDLISPADLESLLRVPSAQEIKKMGLVRMLAIMLRADLSRPFLIGRMRRHALRRAHMIPTLGGLVASRNESVESIIASVRRQSRLMLRMAFLHRTERVFHLWHVIHRPFSLSFVALILIHIGVVLLLGYY